MPPVLSQLPSKTLKPSHLTLSNAGFSDYTVSLTPNGKFLKVGAFTTQRIPMQALKAADYTVYVTMSDNVQRKVVFDAESGEVTSPAMLNEAIMPGQGGGITKQVLRASRNRPFALRSWTIVLGSPWFCVAGSVAFAVVLASAIILGVVISRRKQ